MAQLSSNYIVSALKSGFTISQIAQGLGCTPSAIEQRIDAEGLKEIASENSRFKNIDEMYNRLEEKALKKLDDNLQFAVLNPIQACRVITTLNNAKRRSLSEGQTILNQNNTALVQLNLPKRHQPKVIKNDNNEVIEVNERVYQTLPSAQLQEVTEQKQQQEKEDAASNKPKTVTDYL